MPDISAVDSAMGAMRRLPASAFRCASPLELIGGRLCGVAGI